MKKFAIGRYYFNSLFKEEAEASFIVDLMKRPLVKESIFSYAIGNVTTEEWSDDTFVRATFGRVRQEALATVYDEERKEFREGTLPEVADIMLEFLIHPISHLIFIECDSRLTPQYFSSKFKKIYANTAAIAELDIELIFVEGDIYDAINKWDRVEEIDFRKLKPSNPSSLDDFEEIDKLLRETKSDNTKMEFKSPPKKGDNPGEGLNPDSKLIKQALALSAHGYGEAKLKGKKGEKEVEIESGHFLKKVEIDFREDGSLGKIMQTIEEINKGGEADGSQ